MTGTSVVYPRFLGVDENGDFVWELANGRWTWGDDPHQAADRKRTFTADRYVEKYGAPQPLPGQGSPKQAEAEPVSISVEAVRATSMEAFADGQRRGAERALRQMLDVLDGWIEGSKSNHQGMGHRGESTGSECWRSYAPEDIRRMVNDAAREVGVVEFDLPGVPEEDKPLAEDEPETKGQQARDARGRFV